MIFSARAPAKVSDQRQLRDRRRATDGGDGRCNVSLILLQSPVSSASPSQFGKKMTSSR